MMSLEWTTGSWVGLGPKQLSLHATLEKLEERILGMQCLSNNNNNYNNNDNTHNVHCFRFWANHAPRQDQNSRSAVYKYEGYPDGGRSADAVAACALLTDFPIAGVCQNVLNLLPIPSVFSLQRALVRAFSVTIVQSGVSATHEWSQCFRASKRNTRWMLGQSVLQAQNNPLLIQVESRLTGSENKRCKSLSTVNLSASSCADLGRIYEISCLGRKARFGFVIQM